MITCPADQTPIPYVCYYCSRKFNTQAELDAHGQHCLIGRAVTSVGRAYMWWQQRKQPKPPAPGGQQ